MPTETGMETTVAEIVRRTMPSAEIARVDVKPYTDSDGEKSLSILIVVHARPPAEERAKLVEVVDEFRTWLANRGDERFPYFRLLSESEERELQNVHS